MIDLQVGIGSELFTARGTIIRERNYLDVFKYERLSENVLPSFVVGEEVEIVSLTVEESTTVVSIGTFLFRRHPSFFLNPS